MAGLLTKVGGSCSNRCLLSTVLRLPAAASVEATQWPQNHKKQQSQPYVSSSTNDQLNPNQNQHQPQSSSRGSHHQAIPETVRSNVKNVTGWRGGAERGFLAAYPDCVHSLLKYSHPKLRGWNTQVLTYNLSSSVVGPRFGMLVPITYYHLGLKKGEEMDKAHILGWCVELIRASRIVVDDTTALDTNTSNINRPFDYKKRKFDAPKPKGKVDWATKHKLGSRAFADAMVLDNSVQTLIKHYFEDDPRCTHFFHSFQDSFKWTTLGRSLEYDLKRSAINSADGTIDISKYSLADYKTLMKSRNTFTNYCLPVSLALHLEGIHEEHLHKAAHNILHELGYFAQLTRDFQNCYVNEGHEDIVQGRLTWQICVAFQRANNAQKRVLMECYGDDHSDPGSAEKVMKIYRDLNMKKSLQANIEECGSTIQQRIQQISKIDNFGLTQDFFFRLMDSMRLNDIP